MFKRLISMFLFGLIFYAPVAGWSQGMDHSGHATAATDSESDGQVAYSDRAFLSGMIPHHEAAIDMAKQVIKNGKDPVVKLWGQEVVKAQDLEIKKMREWLVPMGGPEQKTAEAMTAAMNAMTSTAEDSDPDVDFVKMMILHHAGAVQMSLEAMVFSKDNRVLDLANDIIVAQAKEIRQYKEWLAKHNKL